MLALQNQIPSDSDSIEDTANETPVGNMPPWRSPWKVMNASMGLTSEEETGNESTPTRGRRNKRG